MLDDVDAAYFLTRAQEERRKADALDDPAAAELHYQMAEIFEEKAAQLRGMVETD